MKAKNTVLKMRWMDEFVQKDQDALLLKQAKVSFRAGMQEVVSWINEHGFTTLNDNVAIRREAWSIFKKEHRL